MDKTQANARHHSLKMFHLESDDEPIKFVNLAGLSYIQRNGNVASGYFTLAKWFYGADPTEIEERLGLRRGEFGGIAYTLVFERLPTFDEFSYELTAAYPGGKYWPRKADVAELQNEQNNHIRSFDRSSAPVGSYYPRGDGVVHQWRLLRPLAVSQFVRIVTPTLRFARRDGSSDRKEPNLGRLRGVDWP